jgi:hypothetical protein
MAGADVDRRHAALIEAMIEKSRKRTCLEHHPHHVRAVPAQRPGDRLGVCRAHATPHDRAGLVDHTDVRHLVGNIQSSVISHGPILLLEATATADFVSAGGWAYLYYAMSPELHRNYHINYVMSPGTPHDRTYSQAETRSTG